MKSKDLNTFDIIPKGLAQDVAGPQFYLPKKYLDQITETSLALKRIEVLLETIVNSEDKIVKVTPERVKEKKSIHEIVNPVSEKLERPVEIPYLSMKLKNSPDFYKVSRSFLADIELGKNNFGFQRMVENQKESFLSIFASFISYSLNNIPVLIIVEDFEKEEWNKIRKCFSIGSILSCKCFDWGNVSIIERKEILRAGNGEYKNLYESIKTEFKAVFWSVSSRGIHHDYAAFSYFVLDSLNSMTLVIPDKKAKISEVVKAKSFYSDYKIPIKGLLNGE